MTYGPAPHRVAQARAAVTAWARSRGMVDTSGVDVSYLGARGGYVIVSVTGLIAGTEAEAMVSQGSRVRVFVTSPQSELVEVDRLDALIAA